MEFNLRDEPLSELLDAQNFRSTGSLRQGIAIRNLQLNWERRGEKSTGKQLFTHNAIGEGHAPAIQRLANRKCWIVKDGTSGSIDTLNPCALQPLRPVRCVDFVQKSMLGEIRRLAQSIRPCQERRRADRKEK